ncbi:MAG: T9SS type A sorting domain-containing protein [Chitinophagales bacterium]|nr:T9SS type A sorting domain-containing protein [Chitinophagales bacterium]
MIALQSAHGQDSLGILEAIRQNVTAQDRYAFHLAQLQNSIEQQRSQQTQTAIQLNNALPADAIYESNRKTVNEIYLQTLAQNIVTLTPAQLAQVSAIAHQCVFEGGAAVLDARLLYQLHEIKSFDEDTLCAGSRQQRVTAVQNAGQQLSLQPNPADNLVLIKGIPEKDPGDIRIQLNSAHGQSRTIRPTQAFFSVADLPAGVYYCTIWNGDLCLGTQRLLVIH